MYYRSVPITVLTSDVTLKYLDHEGKRVQLIRRQTLRANQRNVTAFNASHSTSTAQGRIPRDEISVEAYCISRDLKDRAEIYGQENRSLEVIHVFGRPMPYAWFMPVVPIMLLRNDYEKLPRLLRRFVVRRTHSSVYENEFNFDSVMQFKSERYPTHNVVFTFDFSLSKLPPQEHIKAIRIKNYGVVDLDFEYNKSDSKLIFRVDKLQDERIRISWPVITKHA
jgi:hypothetical protein